MGGISGHASQPAIYAVISTSAVIAILAVALRLYTRFKIVKKPDWDDLLSGFALLFTIIFRICVTLQSESLVREINKCERTLTLMSI